MRARLLQFVTGTSKVPMNGFAELQGNTPTNSPHYCIHLTSLQVAMVRGSSVSRDMAVPIPSLDPTPGETQLSQYVQLQTWLRTAEVLSNHCKVQNTNTHMHA